MFTLFLYLISYGKLAKRRSHTMHFFIIPKLDSPPFHPTLCAANGQPNWMASSHDPRLCAPNGPPMAEPVDRKTGLSPLQGLVWVHQSTPGASNMPMLFNGGRCNWPVAHPSPHGKLSASRRQWPAYECPRQDGGNLPKIPKKSWLKNWCSISATLSWGVHDQYAEGPGAIMHAFFHELVM